MFEETYRSLAATFDVCLNVSRESVTSAVRKIVEKRWPRLEKTGRSVKSKLSVCRLDLCSKRFSRFTISMTITLRMWTGGDFYHEIMRKLLRPFLCILRAFPRGALSLRLGLSVRKHCRDLIARCTVFRFAPFIHTN